MITPSDAPPVPSKAPVAASLTAAGGLVVTAWLLLDLTAPEPLAVVELFSTLMPAVLFPLFVLAAVCLLAGRWKPALAAVPAAIAFAAGYGACFLPKSPAAPPGAARVSVLTYNLHSESGALAPMIGVIRSSGADVVAVQELSPAAAREFAAQLSAVYPFQAIGGAGAAFGQGILSRYPLTLDVSWRGAPRSLRAVIDISGTQVVFYNAHPPPPFVRAAGGLAISLARRSREIDAVLDRAAMDTAPVILAGDFNMTDWSADYRRVAARYGDAFREAGWGLGFTLPDLSAPQALGLPPDAPGLPVPPMTRIDYVFHSPGLQALAAQVWPESGGSDHRPVRASLAIVDASMRPAPRPPPPG